MNIAFNMMMNYIPVHNALKVRKNGEFLIASNRNCEIYYLNEIAGEMWNIIDGHKTVEDVCNKIFSEYNVERGKLESDVVNFIRDMQWKKLIRLKISKSKQED